MGDQVIVARDQVTAFTLSRQGLLDPFPRQSVDKIVEKIGVLHGQIPATMPIQLWTRMKDFKPDDLWRALYSRRTIVRTWAMRGTLHVIPSKHFETYISAIGLHWLHFWNSLKRRIKENLAEGDLERMRPILAAAFKEKPMTRKEVKQTVTHPAVKGVASSIGYEGPLRFMNYWGCTVHGEMRGPEVVFHDVEEWLGRRVRLYDDAQAGADLLGIYLKTLGPADLKDFAQWTGLHASEVKAAFSRFKEPVVDVMVEGRDSPLMLHRRYAKELEKAHIPEDHVKLLPQLEPVLLGHHDRSRILDREYYGPVFGVTADVKATLLVDGRLAGIWRRQRCGGTLDIRVEPFRQLNARTERRIRNLCEDLRDFFELKNVRVTID